MYLDKIISYFEEINNAQKMKINRANEGNRTNNSNSQFARVVIFKIFK